MRYKCSISYRGENYVGFQSQINGIAIQDIIEEKLKIIFGKDIRIVMASRTDSGVHALNQVFHFDIDRKEELYKIKSRLNGLLPKDIHVNKVEEVGDDFHSRFSSLGKHYRYLINIGEYSPFLENLAYQCPFKLDVDLMIKASSLYLGKHDFSSFNTTPYSVKEDQVREIKSFEIKRKNDLLIIDIIGDGFLRHMVRIMVGTLIDVSRGKKTIEDIRNMLEVPSKDTKRYNASACGLYLVEIYY